MAEDLRGFVTRSGGGWAWTDLPSGATRHLDVDELAAWLDAGASSSVPPLPGPSWIGELVDRRLVVRGSDPTVALTAADVRALDAAPAASSDAGRPDGVLPRPAGDVVRGRRAPLRERAAAERLLEQGWTTVPLLGAGEIAELRRIYGELHGWSGSGFEPDPGNPDGEYRANVSRAVTGVVEDRVDEVMDGFGIFMAGYYLKWPDTPETDLHWDWSSVDESLGNRAYLMWIALQDTGPDNGQMWVLPGSHLVDPRPRGTHLAIPLSDEFARSEERARERLVPVPLRAGEALVFDMGLIHISSPNDSDAPRLACVLGLRPTGVPLVYYRRLTDGVAVRYDVDESWYSSMVPSELMDVPPDVPPDAVVELPEPGMVTRSVDGFLAGAAAPPVAMAIPGCATPTRSRSWRARWLARLRPRRSSGVGPR